MHSSLLVLSLFLSYLPLKFFVINKTSLLKKKKKALGWGGFIGEFHQTFKEVIQVSHKLLQEIEKGTLSSLFYEAKITLISEPGKIIRKLQTVSLIEINETFLNKIFTN